MSISPSPRAISSRMSKQPLRMALVLMLLFYLLPPKFLSNKQPNIFVPVALLLPSVFPLVNSRPPFLALLFAWSRSVVVTSATDRMLLTQLVSSDVVKSMLLSRRHLFPILERFLNSWVRFFFHPFFLSHKLPLFDNALTNFLNFCIEQGKIAGRYVLEIPEPESA